MRRAIRRSGPRAPAAIYKGVDTPRFAGFRRATSIAVALLLTACGAAADSPYVDVSQTHLPRRAVRPFSMDAAVADLDGDGDPDVVVAMEFAPNLLLLNDGSGRFAAAAPGRLPRTSRDSEDIALADFDGDGDIDIVIVSEDDRINEYYHNSGDARFVDVPAGLPVDGITNAVAAADLTGNGTPDLILGNNGQNQFLENDGTGEFVDSTDTRLPTLADTTQDIELGDVDGDGDLDILFANVNAFVVDANPQNRLLLNDGTGVFTDVTAERLPRSMERSFDGDFVDIDGDGDLDIVTANSSAGGRQAAAVSVYENDGDGFFQLSPVLPPTARGNGFDVEAADFDGDGHIDLYIANRGGGGDRLLLRR